ncbi:MAG: dihydrofolate reductase [Deltaproteobacteria bacterium]|nr:dihydrofolate reductase [Deltaproteobacteria bacterium]
MAGRAVTVSAIVAMDEGRVIGRDNALPWHLPDDMKRFSKLTRGHTVLMGRKTFESLPPKYRPLPERKNVVVSRHLTVAEGTDVVDSPEKFINQCKQGMIALPSEKLWVIGGEQIYRAAMPLTDEIYLTLVEGRHDGDAFFPSFEEDFKLAEDEKHEGYSYRLYKRN